MKRLFGICFSMVALFPNPAFAEFVYSGMRQGISYDIYIHEKQDLGNNRWRFRTRAVYSRGQDYYSPWRIADCSQSTIDGKLVPAIARSGSEEGAPKLIRLICQDNS
ncbi:MAG: hypothetical protein WCO45_04030 [Pseudanabaena sp. ELA607]|jgi:hypothetical protein